MSAPQFTLPIVDRLRKRIVLDTLHTSLDEAADTIEELYEVLDWLANERNVPLGSLARKRINAALAKVRGEQ